jgi:hypothetical protein
MTKSENLTVATRKEIMRKFLRTLVWIDDEIRPDKTDIQGDRFRSFFYPTTQEFQKNQILVHLHPYQSDLIGDDDDTFSSDNSDSFNSALNLAKTADIILLDWHLGRKDPNNSIKLLKHLDAEPAIRIVIILSQYADSFEEEMQRGGMLATSEADSNNQKLFKRKGDAWVNDLGTHITVMNKPDLTLTTTDEFCNDILDSIFKLMSTTSPDYLHWIAFEIAGKLRLTIPEWIQALPKGTDAAILSELLSIQTEARDFIPENLLEDLSHIAKLKTLNSLEIDNCKVDDWTNKSYETIEAQESTSKHEKIVNLKPVKNLELEDIRAIRVSKGIVGAKKEVFEKSRDEFISSQQTFTEFCEHISKAPETSPTFGSIYVKPESTTDTGNKAPHTIYLCLSQECDAIRKNNLILLEGSIANGVPEKEGATKLSYQKNVFIFSPEAISFQAAHVTSDDGGRTLKGFKKVGQLRKTTASRILNRYWNYLNRSAVNLPTFARVDRNEK